MSERPLFLKRLERNGCRASVVSISHLDELREEITSLHENGLLDDEVYRRYSDQYFQPTLPKGIRNAKSIIVVAVPQSMMETTFKWQGHEIRAIVPPTYPDSEKLTLCARKELKSAFRPKQYRLVRSLLPVKLLAVRSGLARYGRNNITYVPGLGSFHRLVAFFSDYDTPVDNWGKKKALPACSRCRACVKACPTGAITEDRFLIRAERCLTYHNEKDAKHPFPSWIAPTSHNCIVGCLHCQNVCPANKDVIGWCEHRGEFSEDETAYILRGRFVGEKAARMEKKLKRVGLELSYFPRNLKVLVDGQG